MGWIRRLWAWVIWEYLGENSRLAKWILFFWGKNYPIFLEYAVNPRPRYGYHKPPHPQLTALLAAHHDTYRATVREFPKLAERLATIPQADDGSGTAPYWFNQMLPPLDAISLVWFLTEQRPRRYVEVGSGNSTKFARWAIRGAELGTTITSIDPQPRAEIETLVDVSLRRPLEECDLALFDELEAGDILFVDNSHRSFMNSDVTIVFLDILPNLKPGVLVALHDIVLPWDYSQATAQRYYNEQYLLACHLLGGGGNTEIVLPVFYLGLESSLSAELPPLWKALGLPPDGRGALFWLRTT